MGAGLEAVTAVLCVLGLTGFLWWLLGRLLRPRPGQSAWIMLPGRGDGAELEQSVRGFIWLRSLGVIKCPILFADLGLNPEGRAVALRLCARWPGVVLWPGSDLYGYLKDT